MLLLSVTRTSGIKALINAAAFATADIWVPSETTKDLIGKLGPLGNTHPYRVKVTFGDVAPTVEYRFETLGPAEDMLETLTTMLIQTEHGVVDLDDVARECGGELTEQAAGKSERAD